MESYLLFIGFFIGVIVTVVVWVGITIGKLKGEQKKLRERNEVVSSIEQLCGVVENAFSSASVGTKTWASMKEATVPKLEEINHQLRTHMHLVDSFFIKYIESFLEHRFFLLKQPVSITESSMSHQERGLAESEAVNALSSTHPVVEEQAERMQTGNSGESVVIDENFEDDQGSEGEIELSEEINQDFTDTQEQSAKDSRRNENEKSSVEEDSEAEVIIEENLAKNKTFDDPSSVSEEIDLEITLSQDGDKEITSEEISSEEIPSEEISPEKLISQDEESEDFTAAFEDINDGESEDDEDDAVFLGEMEKRQNPSWQDEFNHVLSEGFDSEEDKGDNESPAEKISLENSQAEARIVSREDESDEDTFEVENTQIYSQDMFSRDEDGRAEETQQPLNAMTEENDELSFESAGNDRYQAEKDVFLDNNEAFTQQQDDSMQPTFEMESSEFFIENEEENQPASESNKPASEDKDDNLITGDDVIKKMDNFFGFDK